MIIKCGACGQDLEIAGTIADGQPILCPVCGETTAYSKPSRIELPSGASRPKAPEPAPPPENDADVPDLPSEEARPKLHVRRPQATNAAAAERANDVVRQVEARANAERKRVRAKRLKAQVNNVVALVVLAAIGFGGYKAYRVYKGGEKVELPPAVEGLVGGLTTSDRSRMDSFSEAIAAFDVAEIRPWKSAPPEMRPKRAPAGFSYRMLIEKAGGVCGIYEMTADGKGGVSVRELSPVGKETKASLTAFNKAKVGGVYLVACAGGVYVCGSDDAEAGRTFLRRWTAAK